ncbi:hypothetical protein Cfor_05009, partial [Coptotermes formosanus]
SVQRKFRNEFAKKPPHVNNIRRCFEQFRETGGVCKRKSSGRPAVTEENVERIRQSFVRSPRKSIHPHSLELGIPKPTVHKVLHKKFKLHAYKIQLIHANKPKRKEFAQRMLETTDNDPNFMRNLMFSDDVTFHINGCLNRHN